MQDVNTTTMTVRPTAMPAYLPTVTPEAIEQAMAIGDLARMSPEVRVAYYVATCQSAGLNPMTRPFDLIKGDDGTVRLYPNKVAAEQLRKLHRVSMRILERRIDTDNGLYIVTVLATTPDGREDEAQGIVDIAGKKGTALANAFLKAETKSKRRATLSLCGLGYDDSEDAGGHPVHYDYQQGHIQTPVLAAIPQTSSSVNYTATSADLYGEPREIPNFTHHTPVEAQTPPTPSPNTFPRENALNRHTAAPNHHPYSTTQEIPPRQAPPQTELHGVEDDDIPPQVHGGELYIDQINAVLRANGESDDGIATYWKSTCRRCKVSSPIAIKAAWLPRLLDERREYYQRREVAQQEEYAQQNARWQSEHHAETIQVAQQVEDARQSEPLAPPQAGQPWRTALADAALGVPETEEAVHAEISAALMSTDTPEDVGWELAARVQTLAADLTF